MICIYFQVMYDDLIKVWWGHEGIEALAVELQSKIALTSCAWRSSSTLGMLECNSQVDPGGWWARVLFIEYCVSLHTISQMVDKLQMHTTIFATFTRRLSLVITFISVPCAETERNSKSDWSWKFCRLECTRVKWNRKPTSSNPWRRRKLELAMGLWRCWKLQS